VVAWDSDPDHHPAADFLALIQQHSGAPGGNAAR
jgi:hypothetical protein